MPETRSFGDDFNLWTFDCLPGEWTMSGSAGSHLAATLKFANVAFVTEDRRREHGRGSILIKAIDSSTQAAQLLNSTETSRRPSTTRIISTA
jgi:hypothetical protein